jgi:hypothetical protein
MDDPQWLEHELQKGSSERWCMRRGCTTCGSYDMFELLTGQPWPEQASIPSVLQLLTKERADLIICGLKHCSRKTNQEAIMWMLQMIWERFGDEAHTNLFPMLEGSYAENILASMRDHYTAKLERRRLHDLQQGLKKKEWSK